METTPPDSSHPDTALPSSVDRRFQLRCPRDRSPMEKFTYAGFHVDRCLSCGCLWFDNEELARVIGNASAADAIDDAARVRHRRKELLPTKLACPRDGTALLLREHVDQPHVDIDQCPSCRGVLLDPGELKDLADLTLAERVRRVWRSAIGD